MWRPGEYYYVSPYKPAIRHIPTVEKFFLTVNTHYNKKYEFFCTYTILSHFKTQFLKNNNSFYWFVLTR